MASGSDDYPQRLRNHHVTPKQNVTIEEIKSKTHIYTRSTICSIFPRWKKNWLHSFSKRNERWQQTPFVRIIKLCSLIGKRKCTDMIIEYTFININVRITLHRIYRLSFYTREASGRACLSRKYRFSRRWKRVKSDPVAARLLDPDVSIKVPVRSVQSRRCGQREIPTFGKKRPRSWKVTGKYRLLQLVIALPWDL